METRHLLGEELFKPYVFLDVIMDELDGERPRYLNCSFPFLPSVEPCLRPPNNAVSVRIDTDCPLNVEALDVYLKVGQRVENTLAFYSPVNSFFFSISLMDDRNTLCIIAR